MSASAEIRRLADEVVQGVKVLDRFNRVRFRATPEVRPCLAGLVVVSG